MIKRTKFLNTKRPTHPDLKKLKGLKLTKKEFLNSIFIQIDENYDFVYFLETCYGRIPLLYFYYFDADSYGHFIKSKCLNRFHIKNQIHNDTELLDTFSRNRRFKYIVIEDVHAHKVEYIDNKIGTIYTLDYKFYK